MTFEGMSFSYLYAQICQLVASDQMQLLKISIHERQTASAAPTLLRAIETGENEVLASGFEAR